MQDDNNLCAVASPQPGQPGLGTEFGATFANESRLREEAASQIEEKCRHACETAGKAIEVGRLASLTKTAEAPTTRLAQTRRKNQNTSA